MNSNLTSAIADLEKRFGKGAVIKLNAEDIEPIETISTGVPSIDLALGVKGLPKGRVTEIYGAESSGKTTLALQVVANAQKAGGNCAFIDVEHALDPIYAQALGVDLDRFLVAQPGSAEEVFEIAEALVKSGEIAVVVVDSVAAMVPQSELNGDFGDAQMGVMARMMSQALRKLTAIIAERDVCFIFINQTRSKIGVVWGSPVTTSGGNALKFYASVRIDINRIGQVKDGEKIVGNRTKVKIVKNKLAPPFREVECDILYGEGISREADLLELGVEAGVVTKSGAWYSYGETRLGQGKENSRLLLKDNIELANEIEGKVLSNDSEAA